MNARLLNSLIPRFQAKTNSNILTVYFGDFFRRYLMRNVDVAERAKKEILRAETVSDVENILKRYNAVNYSIRRRKS